MCFKLIFIGKITLVSVAFLMALSIYCTFQLVKNKGADKTAQDDMRLYCSYAT